MEPRSDRFARERAWAFECWGKCSKKQAIGRGVDLHKFDREVLTGIVDLVYDELQAAIQRDVKSSGDQYDPAVPVHIQLGIAADERLLVALVDEWPEDAEISLVSDVLSAGGTAVIGAEFDIFGLRIIDVARADDAPVRWWQVRGVAESEGFQELPTIYDGPADNVPKELFEKRWSEENIGDLVFRLARQAPWVMLSRRPPSVQKQWSKFTQLWADIGEYTRRILNK